MSRAWAVVASAGVVRLGLGFVASLVIARALGAADFGVYAVLAATVGIVGALAEGGLTEAAVLRIAEVWPKQPSRAAQATSPAAEPRPPAAERPPRAAEAYAPAAAGSVNPPRAVERAAPAAAVAAAAAERAAAFFWLRFALAAVVAALGCLTAGFLAEHWLNAPADLLRWALIGVVATAASGAVSAVLQATGAFGRMSSLTLVNAALTALLALALIAVGQLTLLTALIILGIGTSLAAFAVGWRMLPPGFTLRCPSARTIRHEAEQLLRTGRWLWLASLFAMLTANAEVLLLNHWAALPVVGAYALALSLATKADLVNHSLYTVLLPGMGTLRERHALTTYLKQSLVRGGLIAIALLALVPLAPLVMTLIYGAEFAAAIVFLQLLLGVMIFDVLLTPLLLLPLAYRRPRLLAAGDATRAIVLVLAALALIPLLGAYGAIVARFASRVSGALVVLTLLWSDRATLEVQHEKTAAITHERPAA
ncbi:MAG TPA: oligosaccharide flippase family protein [Chloroflexota bacterium]|nr:oligosaccharide flippase family protein [Chloroflexota bacterium]